MGMGPRHPAAAAGLFWTQLSGKRAMAMAREGELFCVVTHVTMMACLTVFDCSWLTAVGAMVAGEDLVETSMGRRMAGVGISQ